MSIETDRKQVSDQYRAVAHMAKAIALVHDELAPAIADGHMDKLLDMIGSRSAEFLQLLGDIMNVMDIVEDGDSWIDPIIAAAEERFPANGRTEP